MKEPSTSVDVMGRLSSFFERALSLSGGIQHRAVYQRAVLALVAIWISYSLSGLFWSLWAHEPEAVFPSDIVNPVTARSVEPDTAGVDLEAMLGLGLFGEPLDSGDTTVAAQSVSAMPPGVEADARETRLDLVLVGILAESDRDLGSAVIEIKGQQKMYVVGDELPIGGKVSLAKVLPKRVILNNNGTYELLKLFEDNAPNLPTVHAASTASDGSEKPPTNLEATEPVVRRTSLEEVKVAASYREQLYERPETLAGLVQIQPVQGAGGLRGYRVSPGSNAKEFRALGFQAGDIVTAVNGLSLADPGNGVRLYGLMREATEALFTIERNGSELTLAVGLVTELQEQ